MNFKDAAIKVLTDNKKPLHYKKITTIALSDKLLDFLGTSPEKRMLDSLKLEVKKKDTLVSVVRPGFFILKEFYNKNIKNNKEHKSKKRIESLKKVKAEENTNLSEIDRIADYSKQIFSKQYFSEEVVSNKNFKLKSKNEIARKVLDYIIKQKKAKYYTLQDLLTIIEKEKLFDINRLSIAEMVTLISKFNKFQKADAFFVNGNKVAARSLIESPELSKNLRAISEELRNRENLINREIVTWFNKLSFGQFLKLSKIILESLGLYDIKSIKGFPGYHFLTQKLGLSELNLILLVKKGKDEITRSDIIEARGVSSRFGYSNIIILTSSQFSKQAMEETKLTGANIILMDKHFLFESMKKYEVGVFNEDSINKMDYNFFLSL